MTPPTAPQLSFLAILANDRPSWASSIRLNETAPTLDKGTASRLIDQARQIPPETAPRRSDPSALPLAEIQAGSYWTTAGEVARVRPSQAGRLYAEQLSETSGRFEYVKGLIFRLRARMTLDEAKSWGALHGRCCVCAALLTDPKSVAAGIGPVCARKV